MGKEVLQRGEFMLEKGITLSVSYWRKGKRCPLISLGGKRGGCGYWQAKRNWRIETKGGGGVLQEKEGYVSDIMKDRSEEPMLRQLVYTAGKNYVQGGNWSNTTLVSGRGDQES